MKRALIALAVLVLLPGVVFLVFFTASKYRVKGQGYFQSLSDFVFMVGTYNSAVLGMDPPELTDGSYEQIMRHAHRKAHREVENRVVWSLTQWGEAVAPRLVGEIDEFQTPERVSVAATALGRMQYAPALPIMVRAFDEAVVTPHLQIEILDALSELGPEAAPFLIETYQTYRAVQEDPPYNLLDAISESGGGGSFLIAEMDRAETADEIHRLEWPLAKTRDPRAARVLVSLLPHPRLDVRQRALDSMSQLMGAAAVEPALDSLEVETDDYLRSWIIRDLLASRQVSGSPRAVAFLGKQLNDPIVGDDANYALARIGTEEAIEHLRNQIAHRSPQWVMDNLEYTGNVALRILEDYLRHPEGIVRRAAIGRILDLEEPEAIDVLRNAAEDSDPRTRRFIRNAIHQMDLLLLEISFIEWFAQKRARRYQEHVRPLERERESFYPPSASSIG